jgi:hypothetical protein
MPRLMTRSASQSFRLAPAAFLCLVLLPVVAAAQGGADGIRGADAGVAAQAPAGGSITLYARDPLARTLCFADGLPGTILQSNEIRNRCSDLDFGAYNADSFSVGVEGARLGTIVDLGSEEELKQRYNYTETVGGGQGFASLQKAGATIRILKDRRAQTTQELTESELLFREGRSTASAPVKLGHLYLLRLTDGRDKAFERIVKLKVVAYSPGEFVTIRWQVI